ncbi:hypothetical protein ENSA5_06910 [Enhygromyxa salina]|uniref:Uncharacterized protein n=1 Tax=Enhygromyxa salina TaxID=215803 RepID=A0A2S9YHC9_9BACT|nr:hypothetical protein ENSA5_06910 [Enhygromyxa salina]
MVLGQVELGIDVLAAGRAGRRVLGQADLDRIADLDLELFAAAAAVGVVGHDPAHAHVLAPVALDPGVLEHVVLPEDQREVREHPAAQEHALGPALALADVADGCEDLDLVAEPGLEPGEGVPVGQRDQGRIFGGLGLELLDELGPAIPPARAQIVVGVAARALGPDPALGLAGFGLGGHELVVEAPRVAVLGEVGAHARAHRLDVVVDPLAVTLDEHVGQEAVVAAADLLGVIALEPDRGHAGEEVLGPVLGVHAERRRDLDRAAGLGLLGLEVGVPADLELAPGLVGLEGLFGVDRQQPEARVEAVDLDGVAVDDRVGLERVLADDQARVFALELAAVEASVEARARGRAQREGGEQAGREQVTTQGHRLGSPGEPGSPMPSRPWSSGRSSTHQQPEDAVSLVVALGGLSALPQARVPTPGSSSWS